MPSSYRVHRVVDADPQTDFTMAEVFGGPLAPLVGRFVPDMTDSFAQFGDAVAAAAVRG